MASNGFNTAHIAMQQYVADDEYPHNICFNAGIAVEIVVKSFLLERSPSLILDARPSSKALQSVAGIRSFGPTIDFPTVGFSEALSRASWIWPDFPFDASSDRHLIDNRNASAHAGLGDPESATKSISIMVRLIQWIHDGPFEVRNPTRARLGDLNFWGSYAAVAEDLLKAGSDVSEIRAQGKISAARSEFRVRYGSLTEDQRAPLFRSLTSQRADGDRYREWISDTDLFDVVTVHRACPACEQLGWLIAEVETVDADVDVEDGDIVGAGVRQVAHPVEFKCPVCGLGLWQGEVSPVGLGEDIDLGWTSA